MDTTSSVRRQNPTENGNAAVVPVCPVIMQPTDVLIGEERKKKTKTAVLGPSLRVVSPVYRVAQQHSDRSLEGEKGCGSVLARGRSKCMITRKIQEPPVHLLKCLANQYTPTALTLGTVQTTIQGFLRILRGRRRARRWSMGRLRGRPREAGRLEGFL